MSSHIADHIKAVFFDYDDTLVGTYKAKWEEHRHVAKTYYGKHIVDDDIRQHWGKSFEELVKVLYGTDDAEKALALLHQHDPQFPKVLFVETVPMLERLRATGRFIGIVTATTRHSLENSTESHKVPRDLFHYIQTADDTEFHKPNPLVFEPAIAWLAEQNVQPAEVIYVGDGLHDMKAAIGAGFQFLGVETGLVTNADFIGAGARSIPSIAHLI